MKVKLSDICLITSSKRIFEREYVKTGVPFIRGQEVSDGSIEDSNSTFECYISKERYNELKEKYIIPKKNDILITAVGTIGNLYYVDNDFEFYFKDGNLILFTNFSEMVYPKYLYYFMKSPYFKKQIEYSMIGAVQKALTMVMLSKIEIDLPSYNEQVKIANIFSKLDNKIKNNKNINSELESMAKTIYDYWFLQYEFPNEEVKPYKSSGGKMVYNEELKKEIPEGWKVESLSKLATFNNGINYDKDEIGDKKYKIINVRNITSSSLLINDSELDDIELKKIQGDKYLVESNDILIARSGTPGAVRLLLSNPDDIIYCGFIIKCKPNNEKHRLLLTYYLKMLEGSNATKTGGSIMQNVSQDTLKQVKICLPTESVISIFNEKILTLLNKMQCLIKENEELAKLRDELLPLLMNGQVSFKN